MYLLLEDRFVFLLHPINYRNWFNHSVHKNQITLLQNLRLDLLIRFTLLIILLGKRSLSDKCKPSLKLVMSDLRMDSLPSTFNSRMMDAAETDLLEEVGDVRFQIIISRLLVHFFVNTSVVSCDTNILFANQCSLGGLRIFADLSPPHYAFSFIKRYKHGKWCN